MIAFDSLWLLLAVPPLLVSIYAQLKVKSTYGKYSKVLNSGGLTGMQAAQMMISKFGLEINNISIVRGNMTDHYDPSTNSLALSEGTANNASVAAIGIAAHELGHALQDKENYSFMKLRTTLVPLANIGTTVGYVLFMLGFLLSLTGMVWIGVILFAFTTLFSLVTLPVEFNASNRAMRMIKESGVLAENEIGGVKSVLNAAALTYLAATLQYLANLAYFVIRASGRR